jgi:hypothetical protein
MALTEPTIAELNKKVDERHEEVSARLEQLSVGMNDIRQLILSRQNDGEEHSSHRSQPSKGNRHDGPQQHYATRISKIDFPGFDGKKMKEWLYKCDQFFCIRCYTGRFKGSFSINSSRRSCTTMACQLYEVQIQYLSILD